MIELEYYLLYLDRLESENGFQIFQESISEFAYGSYALKVTLVAARRDSIAALICLLSYLKTHIIRYNKIQSI